MRIESVYVYYKHQIKLRASILVQAFVIKKKKLKKKIKRKKKKTEGHLEYIKIYNVHRKILTHKNHTRSKVKIIYTIFNLF